MYMQMIEVNTTGVINYHQFKYRTLIFVIQIKRVFARLAVIIAGSMA